MFTHKSLLLTLTLTGAASAGATLNDTGQLVCHSDAGPARCTELTTGDAAGAPGQDGRTGRDARAVAGELDKVGAGDAGFDFTPLDADGNPVPLANGQPILPFSCVRDNHTGLVWEIKNGSNPLHDPHATYTWHDSGAADPGEPNGGACNSMGGCDTEALAAAVNAEGLCGFTSGWRLPTRREALSIIHYGRPWPPMVDVDFFPALLSARLWTSDESLVLPSSAWVVTLGHTEVFPSPKSDFFNSAWLVRPVSP